MPSTEETKSKFAKGLPHIIIGVIVVGWMISGDIGNESKNACEKDWRSCVSQSDLANNYNGITAAKVACKMRAEEMAKYGDPEFPWGSFDTFNNNEKSSQTGRVTLIESGAKFQNGFGAMKKVEITCLYDLRAESLISVNIQ